MSKQTIFSQRESAVRSYCRSFPDVFDKAEGSYLWAKNGRRYIDLLMGAGALNYGHNPLRMKSRMIEYLQRDGILHGLDLHTRAKEEFLTSFTDNILTPRLMDHRVMFSGPTGTNSVEAAFKIARLATGRTNIAAFTNGYHGMTAGALAATGNRVSRNGAGIPLCGIDRYLFDGYLGCDVDTLNVAEKLIDDPSSGYDAPAAFVVETIQGEGGLLCASFDWLQRLSTLAHKYNSLLIIDDIQAGCGRSGTFFSFEKANISPDIICLSKSISGSGLPMSLVLIKPEYDVFLPGQHNGTFRGNNLAFVSACEAINYWSDKEFLNGLDLRVDFLTKRLDNIVAISNNLFSRRGRGLMQGIVCPTGEVARTIVNGCFDNGLIIETSGSLQNVIKILPALNIDWDIFDLALKIISEEIISIVDKLKDSSLVNTEFTTFTHEIVD